MAKQFPYIATLTMLKGDTHGKVFSDSKGQNNGLGQFGHEKWCLPAGYADLAETFYNFEARPDDVFICTFPRSGTTWTQEMIWLMCNNLDYETALKVKQVERFPFLEMNLYPYLEKKEWTAGKLQEASFRPNHEKLAAQTTRRFIKTHFPLELMPLNIKDVGARVVYIARNPKDVAVSYYYFQQGLESYINLGFTGDFDTFLKYFKDDEVVYGPYWKHVIDGWSHRNDDNVHFMFYEDAKLDMENTLKKLSDFLGHPLKDEDLPDLMNHLDVDSFKQNDKINFRLSEKSSQELVRRGKVGGNPEITEEFSKKIDEWTEKNLANSDLKFPFC